MTRAIATAVSAVAAVCNIVLMVRLLVENMKKRTKFHIIAERGNTIEEVLELVKVIQKRCPRTEISVDMEV